MPTGRVAPSVSSAAPAAVVSRKHCGRRPALRWVFRNGGRRSSRTPERGPMTADSLFRGSGQRPPPRRLSRQRFQRSCAGPFNFLLRDNCAVDAESFEFRGRCLGRLPALARAIDEFRLGLAPDHGDLFIKMSAILGRSTGSCINGGFPGRSHRR